MRKFFIGMIAGLALTVPPAQLAAQNYSLKVEKQQLKVRQKQEWKALKLRERYQKQSWKHQRIAKSVRVQAKHQMQRERRELRVRHKDELQDLKDRGRALHESQKVRSQ
jgi:F0F1-type ATP synthase membrane subunit b/b'